MRIRCNDGAPTSEPAFITVPITKDRLFIEPVFNSMISSASAGDIGHRHNFSKPLNLYRYLKRQFEEKENLFQFSVIVLQFSPP
jgi:hypothetical protein